uniref:Proline rich membrane anchor 1 n=1 Tax=Gasterosteus aculeatus aculeatus TaxID=481459 RepID=A0AAQ4QTN0_GASAC
MRGLPLSRAQFRFLPKRGRQLPFPHRHLLRGAARVLRARRVRSGLLRDVRAQPSSPHRFGAAVVARPVRVASRHPGVLLGESLQLFLQGELQRSCSRTVAEKVSEECQLACHCRRYPPLPPPPPPPPPPRLLDVTVAVTEVPLLRPWWMEMDVVVLGTVGCASAVFLLSAIIICYKAIKRKPLRKEENGTSRGEYAMSIRNKKAIGTNNTVV